MSDRYSTEELLVRVGELTAVNEGLQARLADLRNRFDKACQRITAQDTRLAEAEARIDEMSAAGIAQAFKLDQAEARLAEAVAERATLVSVVASARERAERAEARLAEVEEELAQWRATGESVTRNEHDLAARLAELEVNALRELAAAQTAYVARGMELRDAEARLAEAESALHIYGGHIPPCPGRPCYCGFQKAWEALSTNSPKVSSELVDSTPDSAPACLRCGGDGTVPSLDEYGFPARDLCPDCAPAAEENERG